jgi:hypothetical protein
VDSLAVKIEALNRPLSIDSVRDGGAYALWEVPLVATNLFLKVGHVDELFIKIPSERGSEDYRNFVKLAHSNPQDIRALEEVERFENLQSALGSLNLKHLAALGDEVAHYLAVHALQYERLQHQTAVGIPRARFGVLRSTRLAILRNYNPAMFQERVRGSTLWSMYDFAALRVASRWRPYLSTISAKLSELLDSGLVNHIDWNIQNFVFKEADQRLFYVDLKPTTFVSKESNEHNLKGIRDYFIV